MNVILFGYRGCGKTTLGRMLAEALWKTFADVDQEVCRRFDGLTIAEIWERFGEPKFRETEAQVAAELCAKDDMVIALGGGTLMDPRGRAAVAGAKDAVRIYLFCRAEELWRRIAADANTAAARPNLTGLGGGLDEVRAVLAVRDPVYRAAADKVFDVSELKPEDGLRFLIAQCL